MYNGLPLCHLLSQYTKEIRNDTEDDEDIEDNNNDDDNDWKRGRKRGRKKKRIMTEKKKRNGEQNVRTLISVQSLSRVQLFVTP